MTDSPSVPDAPPLRAQLALAFGIAVGAWTAVSMAAGKADLFMLNLEVYYYTAEAVLSGAVGDLYTVAPPDHPVYRFVYPPLTVVAFVPYALFPSPGWAFVAHTALQVAAGLALAALLVRETERRGVDLAWIDRALVAGFVVASVHTVPTLFFGNVNLSLALALAVGLAYADRRPRLAGVAFALPVGLKAFPAGIGLWWLRRRAWRPIAVLAGTAAVAGGASFAVFGVDLHRTYVREALLDRVDPSLYAGGIDPDALVVTVRRPLSILFPAAPRWALAAGAALALAPFVAAAYTRIDGPVDRLVAIYVTVTAVLLFFPSYFVYLAFLYFPLVPLLYLLGGRSGRLFALGAAVTSLAFSPGGALGLLGRLPDPLAGVATTLRPALVFASPSLWGLAITLVACLHYRFAGDP